MHDDLFFQNVFLNVWTMYEENVYVPLSVSCVPLTEVLNYFCIQYLPSTTWILIDLIVFLLQICLQPIMSWFLIIKETFREHKKS